MEKITGELLLLKIAIAAFSVLLIVLLIKMFAGNIFAPYWFQFGAKSGSSSSFNNGAKVEIQTIVPQNITNNGLLAFWVGETLSNGAFLQVGYEIESKTGYYSAVCNESGCTNAEKIKASDAEWFYEYYTSNAQGKYFGAIGPDGSAGANGTFNTYGFYSAGDTWYFTFDGQIIGNINLETNNSGINIPEAVGELAGVNTNNVYIKDVIFSNLYIYKNGNWLPVSSGYAYINYGTGSKKILRNPYGVEELNDKMNYFIVGSGLPQFNGEQLWNDKNEV